MRIRPSDVGFSHDSISHRFSCGRLVTATLEELRSGQIDVSIIPQMFVSQVDGCWFAYTGNRRLWVFRELENEGYLHEIEVQVTSSKLAKKRFTTTNMGASVRVRWPEDVRQNSVQTSKYHEYCFFEDEHVQHYYMATPGHSKCVSLNHDESGYFSLFNGKDGLSWQHFHIPDGLSDSISLEAETGNDPTLVACGSGGRYFVQFKKGNCWYSRCGNSFDNALGCKTLEAIAFAPAGVYWLRYVDGSTLWQRLPRSLDDLLEDTELEVKYVAISPTGAWFVRFLDQTVQYSGLPQLSKYLIDAHAARGRMLVQLDFGANDDFVIIVHGPD
ncbi:unnamed protein product [Symbiodinium sp. CCMP2456]|nr:unnamed protein product [Symbiodinium sp. CCMP2456]